MGWGAWAGWGEAFKDLGNTLGPERLKGQYTREAAERAQAEEDRQLDTYNWEKSNMRPRQLQQADLGLEHTRGQIRGQGIQNKIGEETVTHLPVQRQQEAAAHAAQLARDASEKRKFDLETDWIPKLNESRIATDRAQANAAGSSAAAEGVRAETGRLALKQAQQENTPVFRAWAMIAPTRKGMLDAMNDADTMIRGLGSAVDPEAITPIMTQAQQRSRILAKQAFEEFRDFYKHFGGNDPAELESARRRLGLTDDGMPPPGGGTAADQMSAAIQSVMKP